MDVVEPVPDRVHVVLMGVSGTGKTTIGRPLADALGCEMAEGDDFHPPRNREKMAAGRPLTDEDRWPWLKALADWTGEQEAAGRSSVLACSALRRVYRDVLRSGADDTFFVHLAGDRELIEERMSGRDHYMPVSLLGSQLATLEPLQPDEWGITVDVADPADLILAQVLAKLGRRDASPDATD